MRRQLRMIALGGVFLACASQATPGVPISDFIEVLGRVTASARPIDNAFVVALNLSTFTTIQTISGHEGEFRLPPLASGVYRVIAVKHGFSPTAVTVLPLSKELHVALKMQSDPDGSRTRQDEIWSLRSSLPSDVLRELEMVAGSPEESESHKFQAEMQSLSSMSSESSPSLAQTALGVRSEMANGWQVAFKGNVDRIDDPVHSEGTSPAAESSGMVMEVQSSPDNSYRLASTRSSWRDKDDGQADLQNQNFEWRHGDNSRVEIHYLSQDNLYSSAYGSDLVEIAGQSRFFESSRSDMGVGIRVAQETIGRDPSMPTATNAAYRRIDLDTNGRFDAGQGITLRYGLRTHLDDNTRILTPETAAEVGMAAGTKLLVTGMYKVLQEGVSTDVPSQLVVWNDARDALVPRYAYSIGILSGDEERPTFKAIASVWATDNGVRLVFDDRLQQNWDVLDINPGDVRRDLSVAYHCNVGRRFAVDLLTSAGNVHSNDGLTADRYYFTGGLQSLYTPSGTSLDLTYRMIGQRADNMGNGDLATRRVKLEMAQSLHMTMNLRILLGLELARGDYSPFAGDLGVGNEYRYLGGLGFEF